MMKIKQYAMPADKLAYRIKKTNVTHILAKVGTAEKWGDEQANVDGCLAVRANTMTPEIASVANHAGATTRLWIDGTPWSDTLLSLGIQGDKDIKAGDYECIEVMFLDTKLIFDYVSGDIFSYVAKEALLPQLFVITGCQSTKTSVTLACMDINTLQPFSIDGIGMALLMVQKKVLHLYGAVREAQKGIKEFSRRVITTTYGELFKWAEEHNAKASEETVKSIKKQ